MPAESGGTADNENRELVNPYEVRAPRRFGLAGRGGTLRRRMILVLTLVVSLALVVGSVGSSCATAPRGAQGSVSGAPDR